MAIPFGLVAPFTIIDQMYKEAFELYIDKAMGKVAATLSGPLLACVTLWIIVQGILVMRGDIDARRGVTKMITVAFVVALVSSSTLYHDNVEAMFHDAVPSLIKTMGGNMGIPVKYIPEQLDLVFNAGQILFHTVAAMIPPTDEVDAMSLEGAQFFFYFSLWGIFGVYHTCEILTSVLLAVGPLFIIGFLFEQTQGITSRWVGQLVAYAILLLLISIVANVVVLTMVVFMTAATLALLTFGSTAAKLVGLMEIDLFIMTGNALVVALPAIAASIGGGVGAQGGQMGQSVFRRFASQPGTGSRVSPSTRSMGFMTQ